MKLSTQGIELKLQRIFDNKYNFFHCTETAIFENYLKSWGPPRVKVRGGGKGSWTES